MNLTPEQIELLRKVQEKIRTEPTAYDQESFGYRNKCGTVCCIGGWVCVLSGKYIAQPSPYGSLLMFSDAVTGEGVRASIAAQGLLGLNDQEAVLLFAGSGSGWAEPFAEEWEEAHRRFTFTDHESQPTFAGIAVRYIDYIFENGRVD